MTQADLILNAPGVEWIDHNNLIGGHTYHYRLAAVDTSGNESQPTRVYWAVAVDTRVPSPPLWTEQTWLLHSKTDGSFIDWPPDGIVPANYDPVLRLGWQCETPEPEFLIRRWSEEEQIWVQPDFVPIQVNSNGRLAFVLLDHEISPLLPSAYRLKVRSSSGVWSAEEAVLVVVLPNAEQQ
jgi:hypothetical protein